MFTEDAARFTHTLCKSLEAHGICNFMHDITFGAGQTTMLTTHKAIPAFYQKNQIPMLCTDSSGRVLAEGLYINHVLENTHHDCATLMPLLPKIGAQFQKNYGKYSLHRVIKEEDCQHFYSLFFDVEEINFLKFVLNNLNYLTDFLDNYIISAKDLILEAKSKENRIILPDASDDKTSEKFKLKQERISLLHKDSNIPIYLSKQQSQCLSLLMQGKSAKQIAIVMNLSYRTIEHYLEKIKKILGCKSNKEILAFYVKQLP